jgi:hypothetical protein
MAAQGRWVFDAPSMEWMPYSRDKFNGVLENDSQPEHMTLRSSYITVSSNGGNNHWPYKPYSSDTTFEALLIAPDVTLPLVLSEI